MSGKKTTAVLQKQIKDTLKNKEILIQFMMFPLMAVVMSSLVSMEGLPANYFVIMFASMYTGMAPLLVMAAIISEEKEKNTLKVLMLSDVRPMEYLTGVGIYVWICCMIGAVIFAVTGDYKGMELIEFLCIMAAGIIAAMLIGAAIGTWSRNQMMATSLSVPFMLLFAFLPMIATFNDSVKRAADITYSGQISVLLNEIGNDMAVGKSAVVILVNMIIAGVLFRFAYQKSGLA